jgi:hypothetical protein
MRRTRTLPLFLAATLVSGLVLTCSNEANEEPPPLQGGGGDITFLQITAKDLKFDTDELVAPANTQITIELENKEAGILHNLSIYRDRSAGVALFIGTLFVGQETRQYQFRTPEPADYFFRCDVHPDTMSGSFRMVASRDLTD